MVRNILNWKVISGAGCLSLLLYGCFGINDSADNPLIPPTEKSLADNYHVELLSGNGQKYTGMSPDPVEFRIYDDRNEAIVEDIYFEDSELWIEISGKQGDFTLSESPAGNVALRQIQKACECFKFHWYLMPADSPEIGAEQVDSVEVFINVFIRITGDQVNGSPVRLVHYPADS
jgi:hypothetical protein